MNINDMIVNMTKDGLSLTPSEKAFLEQAKKQQEQMQTKNQPERVQYPVSFYNNMITFNPYQYKPYFKLLAQESKQKCVYIADEVGVGKTFETGIIISELLYTKEVKKIVIVCPNMLTRKWQSVLSRNFGLTNSLANDLDHLKYNKISIISYHKLSELKEDYNWEDGLLIIDEAHNANGKRFDCMQKLRKHAAYTVLISATPLSGKDGNEGIQKELLFGDKSQVPADFSFTRESVYLNRTLKEELRAGKKVTWHIENVVYEHEGFGEFAKIANTIFRRRNTLRKFEGLIALSSSYAAGKAYIDKLSNYDKEQIEGFIETSYSENEDDADEDYFEDENNVNPPDSNDIKSKIDELAESYCSIADKKLSALKGIIADNKAKCTDSADDEREFYKKIIIFTNFNLTAHYLKENIENSVVINGEIDEVEKLKRFQTFKAKDSGVDVLIITNVAAEGQDMDFCNTIVNYDLHYNPVVLAQRKGRIDRFEVKKEHLFVYNFAIKDFDGTYKVDSIYSVISKKLENIEKSTGIYYDVIGCKEMGPKSGDNTPICEIFKEQYKQAFDSVESIAGFVKAKADTKVQANQILSEKNVNIDFADDVVIKTSKQNLELLRHLFYGGNVSSHMIYSEEM